MTEWKWKPGVEINLLVTIRNQKGWFQYMLQMLEELFMKSRENNVILYPIFSLILPPFLISTFHSQILRVCKSFRSMSNDVDNQLVIKYNKRYTTRQLSLNKYF